MVGYIICSRLRQVNQNTPTYVLCPVKVRTTRRNCFSDPSEYTFYMYVFNVFCNSIYRTVDDVRNTKFEYVIKETAVFCKINSQELKLCCIKYKFPGKGLGVKRAFLK